MVFRYGLFVALFSSLVLSKPLARSAMQVHETRQAAPNGYELSGPASPDTILSLRIALVQSDITGLVDALYNVSTPSSAKYGQHLTKAEVEAYVAPTPETVAAVNSWLSDNGLTATVVSPAGDWLQVDIPVSKANDIIDADFSVFTSTITGSTTVRTLSYSIPVNLAGYIDLVHPTITFSSPKGAKPPITRVATGPSSFDASSPCAAVEQNGYGMTPACLQYLYGIPATPATVSTNRLAVTEYEEQWAQYADLTSFLQEFRPDMNPDTNFTVLSIDGGVNTQNSSYAGVEADLDIQYTVGLATDVPVMFITDGSDDFLTGLLDTANTILALDEPPQVMSTSYGQDEDMVSPLFAQNLCNVYAQLGARGVSLIFSSGDGGVSGNHNSECTTFVPTFPSGCPYITSIGATYLIPEVAVDFSGGGFSNYFLRPVYQAGDVAAYLARLGTNDSGLYSLVGRGYPDVSAYGVDFQIVYSDYTIGVSGTSCSAPTWASVVALLNDRLLAAGKPVLGFLNPFLYSSGASALTDIVSGNNDACGTNYTLGFDATVGWDPVTGLGTPKFASLLSAIGL